MSTLILFYSSKGGEGMVMEVIPFVVPLCVLWLKLLGMYRLFCVLQVTGFGLEWGLNGI